jgi:hypothetical protein
VDERLAIATKVAIAHVIAHDEYDIRLPVTGFSRARYREGTPNKI